MEQFSGLLSYLHDQPKERKKKKHNLLVQVLSAGKHGTEHKRDNGGEVLNHVHFLLIDATECLLLYDANSPNNPDVPYWSYERFDLDPMTDDEGKTEFKFYKNDIRF